MTAYTAAVQSVIGASTLADYYAARMAMQAAWAAALRAMLTELEPCARCRGCSVIKDAGCLYPCDVCCTIEVES